MNDAAVEAPFNLWKAIGLLLATGSLLGLSAAWAKLAGPVGWPPLGLLLWAMLGGAVLQTLVSGPRKVLGGLTGRGVAFSVGSGILFAIPNALAFAAVPHVGVGFISLTFALPLILTYVLALILGLDRGSGLKLAAVLSGVAGGGLMAAAKVDLSGAFNPWALAGLSCPLILAVGNVYRSRLWPQGVANVQLSVGMLVFGAATLFPAIMLLDTGIRPAVATANAWGLLAAQTVTFALLYDVYFRLQKLAGPVYLSQIGSVAAVVGGGLAILLFAETPSRLEISAAVLIGIAVILMNRAQTRGGQQLRKTGGRFSRNALTASR